jgi:SAM-dependent methyltransferase
MLKGQTQAWCDRLATMQGGYFYPWKAHLPPHNGEDTYLDLLKQHINPDMDVLEIGCGHGVDALKIATWCKSLLGYDRVQAFLDTATASAHKAGIDNIRYICADSSGKVNNGRVKIPAEDSSFDLLVSRRGPTNWIEDARRVARPGAVLIQLNPNGMPLPAWNNELPPSLRLSPPNDPPLLQTIEERLHKGGLQLHSYWTFDVPMSFDDPEQLYLFLSFGRSPDEAPAYNQVRQTLSDICMHHSGSQGLEIRRRRLLWKSVAD